MQELWIALLAHWIAAGWLAEGLAGGGWEAGWPQGLLEPREPDWEVVSPSFGGAQLNSTQLVIRLGASDTRGLRPAGPEQKEQCRNKHKNITQKIVLEN